MNKRLNCILVIDDDEPTNFFTRIILEEWNGCKHIKTVQSGQEALDYLSQSEASDADPESFPSPDLIFLDINMPAMNGWEFLDEYTKLIIPPQHKIVMVMLTTSLFPDDLAKSKVRNEVAGFENKPLTIEKLEKIIAKHFTGTFSEEVK
jgi:CheY-like chemotaxis protein